MPTYASPFPVLAAIVLMAGCGADRPTTIQMGYGAMEAGASTRSPVLDSLFASDTAVISNEALEKILDGMITLKANAKVAVLPMGRWGDDDTGTAGGNTDRLRDRLTDPRVVGVTRIPAILLPPDKVTIPYIREACARLQCELVLIYRIDCRITTNQNLFSKDTATSHASVEAPVMDVRTGVVPWTDLADHEIAVEEVRKDDLQVWERARIASVGKGVDQIANDLNAFLATLH